MIDIHDFYTMRECHGKRNKKLLTFVNSPKKSGHLSMTTLRDATNDTTPPFTFVLYDYVNCLSFQMVAE